MAKGGKFEAWDVLLGAQALVQRGVERRFKTAGLPPLDWYEVLWELERAGGELRVGDLAERLVIEPYNCTRLLGRMEAEALLRRIRTAADRRGACAALTRKGRALRRSMWAIYQRAIRELFADSLSDNQAEAMVRGLERVIAALRRK